MRPSRARRRANRISRFEPVEPRWLLSGDLLGNLYLDYLVEDEFYHAVEATLADAHVLTGLNQVRADYGFDGSGQTVVVIDSGIAYDHLALGGGFGPGFQVVGGFDFTDQRDADPYDEGPYGSHGTHVAGIIASNDSISPGVAPGADLVALRVFNNEGWGDFAWVEQALRWVHNHRTTYDHSITTVNLSLGAKWNSDSLPAWANLEEELAQLEADGIFVTVAAGNRFTSYHEPGLAYPAVSPHVVPVGAVDDSGGLSYFSQREQRMIAAPGRAVRSTVPDYVGNRNGVDDDFAQYSGTSMAAPYVAGAGVLLRQACQFVGLTDVTQETLYKLIYNTADTLYDAETGLEYRRLNLDRAIDTVMPDDDFGSSQATAHNLGTVVDGRSLSGMIASLGDQDWFTFTAGATGTVTIDVHTDGDLLPQWQLSAATRSATAIGSDTLVLDVVAGQSYAVGLATDDGLGHYTLEVDLDAAAGHTDWGTVRQGFFDGHRIDPRGKWFDLTATTNGILTIEAMFSHADGDVDLQLHDAKGSLVGTSARTGDLERMDVNASAGETFQLHAYTYAGAQNDRVDFRVTNLVSQHGTTVRVSGTEGNDTFRFTPGAISHVTINGVAYDFHSAAVDSVTFDGLGGSDTAVLNGSSGDDDAVLRAGAAELSGPGYRVLSNNVESVTLRAGAGEDHALLYDSPGNDTFVAARGYAGMFGQKHTNQAEGVESTRSLATEGGLDVVRLYDSPGNDIFVASPTYGALFGDGFHSETWFFEGVHAYATAGGTDVAKLYDSPGDDTFFATPVFGALYNAQFFNRAKFFEQVHAYATAGGVDTAELFDSAGDDVFVSSPLEGALYNARFYNRAKFFEQVHANTDAGGNDRAYVYDASGNEVFQASASGASLRGDHAATWLYGFEYVRASATRGGTDKAEVSAVDYILKLEGRWD